MAFSQLRLTTLGLATGRFQYNWTEAGDGELPGFIDEDAYFDNAIGPVKGNEIMIVSEDDGPVVLMVVTADDPTIYVDEVWRKQVGV